MSRESQVYDRLIGDATLLASLIGGIYRRSATGREGISRETTPATFDAGGYLKPCALIGQRNIVPTYDVADEMVPYRSVSQVVEIFLYEDTGYSALDAAFERIYTLLEGYQLPDGFPLQLINIVDRQRDNGALKGHSMLRVDFNVHWILGE